MDVHYSSQAMCCLISHALKFTPAGGKVTIKITADESSNKICVTENGVGMFRVSSASLCAYRLHILLIKIQPRTNKENYFLIP